jgi:protein tyrosine phosphatase
VIFENDTSMSIHYHGNTNESIINKNDYYVIDENGNSVIDENGNPVFDKDAYMKVCFSTIEANYNDTFNTTEDNFNKINGIGFKCREKNRYKNILPNDDNRVKLTTKSNSETEYCKSYINASYMNPIVINDKEYIIIAAQGPTVNTIPDFIKMIQQQDIKRIIMVTSLEEQLRGKLIEKCADYTDQLSNIAKKTVNTYTDYTGNVLTPFTGIIRDQVTKNIPPIPIQQLPKIEVISGNLYN